MKRIIFWILVGWAVIDTAHLIYLWFTLTEPLIEVIDAPVELCMAHLIQLFVAL